MAGAIMTLVALSPLQQSHVTAIIWLTILPFAIGARARAQTTCRFRRTPAAENAPTLRLIDCYGDLTKSWPAEKREVLDATHFTKKTTEFGRLTICQSKTCVRNPEKRAKRRW